MPRQSCAVCAWRETCAKRFSIQDGGARCPDYSRDVTIKDQDETAPSVTNQSTKESSPT